MRRFLAAVLTVITLFAVVSSAALADSPHFNRTSGALNSDGTLTVSFKEAGLGTNQNIDYLLSADGSAVYVCVNKGGKNPSASNKTTVNGPVSAGGTFSSGKNGSISAALTLAPPSAGDFSCPNGQRLEVASVSYTNVTLTDTTNGIVAPGLGTFESGCLLPDVQGAC